MRQRPGQLTPKEREFARLLAATGDSVYAAEKAGYSPRSVRQAASQNANNPDVMAEALRLASAAIQTRILPLAVRQHEQLLSNPATSDRTMLGAIGLAYKFGGLANDTTDANREQHEMTPAEMASVRDRLTRMLTVLSGEDVVDVAPIEDEPHPAEASAGVFD